MNIYACGCIRILLKNAFYKHLLLIFLCYRSSYVNINEIDMHIYNFHGTVLKFVTMFLLKSLLFYLTFDFV